MRVRVIYNPSAGLKTAREDLKRAVDVMRAGGWLVELAETARIGDAMQLARTAAEQKFDAVIAVGGDGTLNEAANGVVGSETALGTLPQGTANVWAREIGLPIGDLPSAAQHLVDADIRVIDVGEVCGPDIPPRFFVLWSGAGLDALITRNIEPQREMKRRLGALVFLVVGLRDAWNYRGKRMTLILGGKRVRKRIILLLAANAQRYAGVVRLAPNTKLDDGLLEVVVFKGTGFGATAWHLVRAVLGLHVRDPQVEIHTVPSLTIVGKNVPVHVDAEPIGYAPVEIRVRPRALRVLIPKTANKNLFVQS